MSNIKTLKPLREQLPETLLSRVLSSAPCLIPSLILSCSVLAPQYCFASADGESHGPAYWILLVNFIVFATIIYLLTKNTVVDFYRQRKKDLDTNVNAGKIALAQATAELKELQAQADKLDAEKQAVVSGIKAQAEAEIRDLQKSTDLALAQISSQGSKDLQTERATEIKKVQNELAVKIIESAKSKLEQRFSEPAAQSAYRARVVSENSFGEIN